MNNREELIRIIQQSLYGMLEVRLIDEIAPRVADGILNSGYIEGGNTCHETIYNR